MSLFRISSKVSFLTKSNLSSFFFVEWSIRIVVDFVDIICFVDSTYLNVSTRLISSDTKISIIGVLG